MTLLSTKYQAAKNWSQRLPFARDIMAEVRAENSGDTLETDLKIQQIAAEAEFTEPRFEGE
jgi:hypothetical protein